MADIGSATFTLNEFISFGEWHEADFAAVQIPMMLV